MKQVDKERGSRTVCASGTRTLLCFSILVGNGLAFPAGGETARAMRVGPAQLDTQLFGTTKTTAIPMFKSREEAAGWTALRAASIDLYALRTSALRLALANKRAEEIFLPPVADPKYLTAHERWIFDVYGLEQILVRRKTLQNSWDCRVDEAVFHLIKIDKTGYETPSVIEAARTAEIAFDQLFKKKPEVRWMEFGRVVILLRSTEEAPGLKYGEGFKLRS